MNTSYLHIQRAITFEGSNQERRICLMENKKYELDKLMIAMLQILLDNKDIDEKTLKIAIQKIQNQESRA